MPNKLVASYTTAPGGLLANITLVGTGRLPLHSFLVTMEGDFIRICTQADLVKPINPTIDVPERRTNEISISVRNYEALVGLVDGFSQELKELRNAIYSSFDGDSEEDMGGEEPGEPGEPIECVITFNVTLEELQPIGISSVLSVEADGYTIVPHAVAEGTRVSANTQTGFAEDPSKVIQLEEGHAFEIDLHIPSLDTTDAGIDTTLVFGMSLINLELGVPSFGITAQVTKNQTFWGIQASQEIVHIDIMDAQDLPTIVTVGVKVENGTYRVWINNVETLDVTHTQPLPSGVLFQYMEEVAIPLAWQGELMQWKLRMNPSTFTTSFPAPYKTLCGGVVES